MDWRIGRLIRSVNTLLTCPTLAAIFVQPNQQRVGITVWGNPSGDIVGLFPGELNFAFPAFAWTAPGRPIHITIATHGDFPTRKLMIVNQSGNDSNVAITEYFAPEEVLTLGLEELRHKYPGI